MKLDALKNDVTLSPHKTHGNVLTVEFSKVRLGWEQWILFRSDAHQDNQHCQQSVEVKHLDLAIERNALIIDNGDLFCAMQGRGDPRSDYDSLRPEHKRSDYLNALVETAAARYAKYAPNWLMLGRGNHETAVLKNKNFDLTSALAMMMNQNAGAFVQVGGYGGWIKFQFNIQKTVRTSINLKYFHGAGGGGPVTRGVIDTNRQSVFLPDANIIINGHSHDNYILPITRERLNSAGNISHDYLWHIRTPSYKCEYGDGSGGFHVERGRPPKPIGCVWGRFYFDSGEIRTEFTAMVE